MSIPSQQADAKTKKQNPDAKLAGKKATQGVNPNMGEAASPSGTGGRQADWADEDDADMKLDKNKTDEDDADLEADADIEDDEDADIDEEEDEEDMEDAEDEEEDDKE